MRDQILCTLTVSFHPLLLLLSYSFIRSFIDTNECDSSSTYIHTHIPHNPTIIPTAHMSTTFSQSFRFLPISERMFECVRATECVATDHMILNSPILRQQSQHTITFVYIHFVPFHSNFVRLFSQIYIHIRFSKCLVNATMYFL